MSIWPKIFETYRNQEDFVLVTVGQVRGSSPRETGAKMLVSASNVIGTIGGGNMEFQAIEHARNLLEKRSQTKVEVLTMPLIPSFDQCCGGVVELIFETVIQNQAEWIGELEQHWQTQTAACLTTGTKNTAKTIKPLAKHPEHLEPVQWQAHNASLIEWVYDTRLPIYLFGGGHVAQALLNQCQHLPVTVTCIDSRPEMTPPIHTDNIEFIRSDDWPYLLQAAPDHACFLVMTHSHQLDYDITHAILERNRHRFFGLIGSATKKRRFTQLLKKNGISPQQLQTMTCPIGLPSITGKSPQTIAISVIAQIFEMQSKHQSTLRSSENVLQI